MTVNSSDIEVAVATLAQRVLTGPPLIVLGTGSSLAYGVGGMKELAEHLIETIRPDGDDENELWQRFVGELELTKNLEAALQKVYLPSRLLNQVIRATHGTVSADDRKTLKEILQGATQLALTRLYKHLFQSTHNSIDVLTTNYDRLAEYAANVAGFSHYTGFALGHVGLFDDVSGQQSKGRTVRVWKVHGSIDWFEDSQHQPICVPDLILCEGLTPLIVTPGNTKYEQALQEPFRTIITSADTALSSASSYICIGFGFRDAHIEPKLVRRLRHRNVPVAILAKTLTDEAKRFIAANLSMDFLAMEESSKGTRVYTAEHPNGVEIETPNLWGIDSFLDVALGKDR